MTLVPVKITSPTGNPRDTTILVDSQDITKYVQSINMAFNYDGIPRIELSALVSGCELTFPAEVTVWISPLDGFDVVQETQEDGSIRYRMIKS